MENFFASNLKSLRKKSRKTQADVAFPLNKAHTSVGNWEKEIAEPSLAEIEQIARFFGVKPADLLYTDLSEGNLIPGASSSKKPEKGNLKGNPMGNLNDSGDVLSGFLRGQDGLLEQLLNSKDQTIQAKEGIIVAQSQTIDTLKSENERLLTELESLKRELDRAVQGKQGHAGGDRKASAA